MKQSIALRVGSIVCAVALGATLAGCASGNVSATDSQQANRAYMSQVNETMFELDESLDLFVDAVSRGDVVNMRSQADNAYKVLDKLANIEAPDDLKGVRQDYVDGTGKLREALDEYIALYTEMASASGKIDKAAYDERIAEIQALYDEGVALLQKGDATVAGSNAPQSASATSSADSASATDSAESSSASDSAASSAEQAGQSAGSAISAPADAESSSSSAASSA